MRTAPHSPPLLPPRPVGRRSIAALHTAVLLLATALILTGALAVFPEARALLVEHFHVFRAGVYAAWAAGLCAFLLAPTLLVRELGARPPLRVRAIADALHQAGGPSLERAVVIGLIGNAVVLLCSPLGLALGERYTWSVFLAHTGLSVVVLIVTVVSCLARVRALVGELTPPAPPARASHAEPASF